MDVVPLSALRAGGSPKLVARMAEVRTPEGVIVRVTGRSPELFLRIITPSGREFGWPVHAGTIGYDVAKEIAGLASEGEPVSLSDERKRKSAAQEH